MVIPAAEIDRDHPHADVAPHQGGGIGLGSAEGPDVRVPGCVALHVVLGIEVRAHGKGAADGVQPAHLPGLMEGKQRTERRMQSEEAVQIEHPRGGQADVRPERRVGGITDGHEQIQSVGSATQAHPDQHRIIARRARDPRPDRRTGQRADAGGRALQEAAPGDGASVRHDPRCGFSAA